MPTIKELFQTVVTFTTTNLQTLASGSATWWQSNVVDNSANLYVDEQVQVSVTVGVGTIGSDKAVYVYAYASVDGGTTYPDAVTGAEGTFTAQNPTQLRLIGTLNVSVQSATYKSEPFSVAAAFGGVLPSSWGIAIENFCGIALSSAAAKHQPVQAQVV